MLRYSCTVLMILAAVASAYGGDTLEEYAQKCDQAIGVTVPDFNCDSGTLVPTTNLTPPGAIYPNGTCDRPNVLEKECDPGSRFQVLTNNADAYVVAHCRKEGLSAGHYRDIAVISTIGTMALPASTRRSATSMVRMSRPRPRGHRIFG